MIRSVIFDMDGVLIDSEPVYQECIYQGLLPLYPWVKREDFYPMAGMNGTENKIFLARLTHRDAADPAFLAQINEIFGKCKVNYQDIMRPQVPTLLRTLKEMGLKLALASSSSRETITRVLNECGLTQYFDVVISGFEFHESKPNPEIYFCTMERLGSSAEECLIIEDSDYGIEAGTAAGATVAALKDERFPFDQGKAQLHIDSLDEIPGLVRRGVRDIRAAFFDIDGTLAAMGSHKVPESTRTALKRLRERGISVILSTGRHGQEVEQEQILAGLSFDGAVWLNGQFCELGGEVILENYIPGPQLGALKQFLEERQCSCVFLERDEIYCNMVNERIIQEQAKIGTAVPPVRDLEGIEDRKVFQAIPYINAEEEEELLKRVPDCRITRWGDAVVDLISGEGGKEKGIRAVYTAMDIKPEEVMAFGDGENDISMLELAGIGVAMGNAIDEVKKVADYVTDDIEQDGIYNALVYFGLI